MEETLVAAIQRVLKAANSEAVENTIVGSDINQIRHLFYYLRSERLPIFLTYQLDEYKAYVDEISLTTVVLKVRDFEDGPIRRCRLKFEMLGILYQFEVALLETTKDYIVIKLPYFIQSMQPRKFRRIGMDEVFMSFTFNYRPFFNSSSDVQLANTRFPAIIDELKRDEPDIYLINHIITEDLDKISPDFEIHFFKEGAEKNFVENLILTQPKTLYIRETAVEDSYYGPFQSHNLINFQDHYKQLARESSEEDAAKFFENVQKEDRRNFLHSYAYSPILIFNHTVGYMRVRASVLEKYVIRLDQAMLLHLMAGLLSYALSKTVMARTFYKHPLTKIVNLSMGGLLFELNQKELFDYLIFHDNLKIMIHLKHEMLEFHSEISRSFPCRDGFCIGTNFYKAAGDDFLMLKKFLFEKTSKRTA